MINSIGKKYLPIQALVRNLTIAQFEYKYVHSVETINQWAVVAYERSLTYLIR